MNLHEVNMKYGRLVVLMRHDSAEIKGFRYELTICTRVGRAALQLGCGGALTEPGPNPGSELEEAGRRAAPPAEKEGISRYNELCL